MKHLYTLLIVILSFSSFAQTAKLKKANDLYDLISYAGAAQLYSELIGSEVDSPEMKSKLADCYYQMGETDKAEEWYLTLDQNGTLTNANDMYQYAQALKENGKYQLSDAWMDKFTSAIAGDSRGEQYRTNKEYRTQILDQEAYFGVNHLTFNSNRVEFGGYPVGNGQVCFVSNTRERFGAKRLHGWNDKNYLDFYQGQIEEDLNISEIKYRKRSDNSRYHEGPLAITPDGKTVYFTRNNISKGSLRRDDQGIQHLKIYRATVEEDGTWSNEESISLNSREYSVGHPTISVDGKTMYFVSDKPGGFGGADIYKVALNDGVFGEPENLGEMVNTEGQEMFPWLTKDEILFVASDGHVGLGGLDVFAFVPNKKGGFKKRINLGEPVNSSKDDFALIMLDEKRGYLSSNRESGSGDDDIYGIILQREIKVSLTLNGVVSDTRSGEILPGSTVELINELGETVATVQADARAQYSFELEPDQKYTIAAQRDKYFDNQSVVSTIDLPSGTEEINQDVSLEKDPGLSLYALVKDSKTNQPLGGVTLNVIDNMTGEKIQYVTPETGDYLRPLVDKKLDDRGSYQFVITKEGYIPNAVTYNQLFDREGQYDVALSLDPLVEDLRDLIQINPINFDLGKWNIRPDAKLELDKIVEVMNKYPNMEVELGSHTDCRASKSFNMRLSDKRAKSSAKYIKSKITNPERIYGKGYGESKLLNGCECEGAVKSDCSEEEHEKNRRTEFKVISVGDPNVGVQNNSTNSFDN